MISGKYELTIAWDGNYPHPTIRPGADNVELPDFEKMTASSDFKQPGPITHYIEFYEENGVMKACHQTELSKQLVDDLVISANCVSWKAYSGSEGVDLWQYCLAYTEISDDVAGVSFGIEPFFRGYMKIFGKKIS